MSHALMLRGCDESFTPFIEIENMTLCTEHCDFVVAEVSVIGDEVPYFAYLEAAQGICVCAGYLFPSFAQSSFAADADRPAVFTLELFIDFYISLEVFRLRVGLQSVEVEQEGYSVFKARACPALSLGSIGNDYAHSSDRIIT